MRTKLVVCVFAVAGMMAAQQVKLPDSLEKLAEKAKESTTVTLGPDMLGLATKFMGDKKSEEAEAKRIATKLRGVYIRSFEFEKEGEYTEADYSDIRAQLKSPEWTPIVVSKSKKEVSEIYTHRDGGMLILSAEPRELTIVNIVGNITADDIGGLSGQFGVPNIKSTHGKSTGATVKKDEDEE